MTTQPAVTPAKRRRSPALIALAVALVTVGGLLSFWLYTTASDTISVVAARDTIERGSVISEDDLISVQITTDTALHPVRASEADELVGQRAAVDIAGGTLLTSDSVSDELTPAKGRSVVGLNLTTAQRPATTLQHGDKVRIVFTPGDGFDASSAVLTSAEARVVAIGEAGVDGAVVVDVEVDAAAAEELAAQAASGRVALVLDSREQ